MLRVGLTGGLGSGKSTIAAMFAELGVHVIEADAVGRTLMQPGQQVYREIVGHFGPGVVRADGTLDRRALAALAFDQGRLAELNRIVHPAVIQAQEDWMNEVAAADPNAIAMIESALIFEAGRTGSVPDWNKRFDRLILVTAPDQAKIERYTARMLAPDADETARAAIQNDAQRRLAAQIPDAEKAHLCDWVIDNSGDLEQARKRVADIYPRLLEAAADGQSR